MTSLIEAGATHLQAKKENKTQPFSHVTAAPHAQFMLCVCMATCITKYQMNVKEKAHLTPQEDRLIP